jgi:hypothetical protein
MVVPMAAADLPRAKQRQVIMAGIGIACRVVFSLVAVRFLMIVGRLLIPGMGSLDRWSAWPLAGFER